MGIGVCYAEVVKRETAQRKGHSPGIAMRGAGTEKRAEWGSNKRRQGPFHAGGIGLVSTCPQSGPGEHTDSYLTVGLFVSGLLPPCHSLFITTEPLKEPPNSFCDPCSCFITETREADLIGEV